MWICRGDGDGDDEQIQVDLNRIQPHVQQAPRKGYGGLLVIHPWNGDFMRFNH